MGLRSSGCLTNFKLENFQTVLYKKCVCKYYIHTMYTIVQPGSDQILEETAPPSRLVKCDRLSGITELLVKLRAV